MESVGLLVEASADIPVVSRPRVAPLDMAKGANQDVAIDMRSEAIAKTIVGSESSGTCGRRERV